MTIGIHGTTPSPAPADDYDEFTLTVDATGGTFKLGHTLRSAAGGYAGTTETKETANQNHNVSAGNLQTALNAVAGIDGCTVTGGPGDSGGTTPYTIRITKSPVSLAVTDDSLTGGGNVATLVQTKTGPNMALNRTVLNPDGDTIVETTPARGREAYDKQYGQTAYSPTPGDIDAKRAAADSANALSTTTSGIHGHTKSDSDTPTGFKGPRRGR